MAAEPGTRDQILQAADDLFGNVGFDAASTREIAERAGVNKALIHYHFNTKEELFEAVLDRYYARLTARLEKKVAGKGDLRARMGRLMDAYVDFLAANRNFSRIVQREASAGRHMARIRRHMLPIFDLGVRVLHEAYPTTRAGDLAARQILVSFYGMTIGYFAYSELLEHLWGTDLMSTANLRARKRHLRRMMDILIAAVEEDGKRAKASNGT